MGPTITVVTGANSGIGRATSLHLAQKGHRVFAAMRVLERGEKLMRLAADLGVQVEPVVLDVTDQESVDRAFAEVIAAAGHVDILVNNAGVASMATLADIDVEDAKSVFDANVWGVIRCSQAVIESMRSRRSGHLVQLSSIAGRVGLPGQPVYCASKWAIEGLCENLAHDLAHLGVRVSIIEPGVTRTAILAKHSEVPPNTADIDVYNRTFEFYASGIAANVQADEVARTIYAATQSDGHQLRWPVAWGSAELADGRGASDGDWVTLGAAAPSGELWRRRFKEMFGLEILDANPS